MIFVKYQLLDHGRRNGGLEEYASFQKIGASPGGSWKK